MKRKNWLHSAYGEAESTSVRLARFTRFQLSFKFSADKLMNDDVHFIWMAEHVATVQKDFPFYPGIVLIIFIYTANRPRKAKRRTRKTQENKRLLEPQNFPPFSQAPFKDFSACIPK